MHRDIMVWVEHNGPVMFGFNISPHPLRLLYLGRGRTGHYIPIVGTDVLQQENSPVSVSQSEVVCYLGLSMKGRMQLSVNYRRLITYITVVQCKSEVSSAWETIINLCASKVYEDWHCGCRLLGTNKIMS